MVLYRYKGYVWKNSYRWFFFLLFGKIPSFNMNKVSNIFIILCTICVLVDCKKFKENDKPNWAKKDIRDYSDADLERLLDQWEVNFDNNYIISLLKVKVQNTDLLYYCGCRYD